MRHYQGYNSNNTRLTTFVRDYTCEPFWYNQSGFTGARDSEW